MGLLGTIYGWLDSLFGVDLADYLLGFNCESQAYDNQNLFTVIGLITVGISLLMMVAYYYLINSASFNKVWSWAIMLFTVFTISLFVGWGWTYTDCLDGAIQSCLMENINDNHFLGFGIANGIIASFFFFIFSLVGKWWSVNCSHSPF
ncbi:MAG: hypothetical protein ACRCUJ_09085 [Phocaeicola sp.]